MRRWQRVGLAAAIAVIAALLRPRRAGDPTANGDVAHDERTGERNRDG